MAFWGSVLEDRYAPRLNSAIAGNERAREFAPIDFIHERKPGGGRCRPALLKMFVSIKNIGPAISKTSHVKRIPEM
jgi:hypothetical protein